MRQADQVNALGAKELLHPGFAEILSSPQVAFIPLLSKSRVMGVMAVESSGGDRAIDDVDHVRRRARR